MRRSHLFGPERMSLAATSVRAAAQYHTKSGGLSRSGRSHEVGQLLDTQGTVSRRFYEPAPDDASLDSARQRKRYRAFVSYGRTDARVAKRLHSALENYRTPRDLARDGSRRLGRFFKDDDELAGAEQLGAALNGAIDDSENLIVMARTPWRLSRSGSTRRRFASRSEQRANASQSIVRGKPNSGDPETECFPPALRYRVDFRGKLTEHAADPSTGSGPHR